jgi:protein dithiol oxidoreductase (disulfide-forming)
MRTVMPWSCGRRPGSVLFARQAAALGLFVGLLVWMMAAAQADRFEAGVHYRVLANPQPTAVSAGQIEVREFFSYACPFCRQFQPLMSQFAAGAPADVVIVHHPVAFREQWEPLQRAYLVQSLLELGDHVHGAVFVALYEEQRRLGDKAEFARFFAEVADVDPDVVIGAWDDFEVETTLRRNQQLARAVGVTGTPSIMVNGRYYVDPRMAGSLDGLLQVVAHLIDRERRESN